MQRRGGSNLVADTLGNDLPLELGKGQKHVEGQPAHRGRGVELLGTETNDTPCAWIVVSSVWELLHLSLKIAQPCCALWQENLSGFDLGCSSMEPGHLVLLRIDGNRAEATFKSQVLNHN